MPQLEQQAQRCPGWQPFWHSIRGEYEMLRGQHGQAREIFEHVLSLAQPGAHTAWSRTASSHVANLIAMGDYQQAIEFGEHACRLSAEHRVNPLYGVLLRSNVARAYAELGDHERGQLEIEQVLNEANELGMTGVPLGCAYETAARVALCARDMPRFERTLALVHKCYSAGGSEPVAAKYRRLVSDGVRRWSAPQELLQQEAVEETGAAAVFTKQWATGRNRRDRSQLALSAVLTESGAPAGCLFGTRGGSLQLLAASAAADQPELARLADQQLAQALDPSSQTEYTPLAAANTNTQITKPVLLTAQAAGGTVIVGLVVLRNLPATRPLPWLLLQAVSRALLESADVQPIALPDC